MWAYIGPYAGLTSKQVIWGESAPVEGNMMGRKLNKRENMSCCQACTCRGRDHHQNSTMKILCHSGSGHGQGCPLARGLLAAKVLSCQLNPPCTSGRGSLWMCFKQQHQQRGSLVETSLSWGRHSLSFSQLILLTCTMEDSTALIWTPVQVR